MENIKCIRLEADSEQIRRCREKIEILDENVQKTANILNLMGNAVRFRILLLLMEEKRLCPCDLSDILGMTIPAVSQHLRKLKDREMVQTDKEGVTVYYSLHPRYSDLLSPILTMVKQQNSMAV
tara:strand:+ start:6136 stop:6507 length:372 start_codon:yes stop_codon:yes gene_type:complete